MTHELPSLLTTLLERLHGHEDLDWEVKTARTSLPKSLWPTVSAFANTRGGWIVLGFSEGDQYALEGVEKPEALVKMLHDLLRNPQKISHPACGIDDVSIDMIEGKAVVLIRVPAAARKYRPVYINNNPYLGTYVRRYSGDYQCHKAEVDRMMREASDIAADSTLLPHFGIDDLDSGTLARYRRRLQMLIPPHRGLAMMTNVS